MTTPEIRRKFLEILDYVLGCKQNTVHDNSDLIRDLRADSLELLELVLECELEFAVDLPNAASDLKTVKDWLHFLEQQLTKND